MMKLKTFVVGAVLLALAATQSAAQGVGQLPSGSVWGNPGASQAVASPATISAMLDRALGSTRGAIIERGLSAWGIVAPGTAGLPWVSNGAGADPAYQLLTGAGIAAATVANANLVNPSLTLGVTALTLGTTTTTVSGLTLASPTLSGTVAGANTVPLSILAQVGANTMLGNWGAVAGNVAANAMPSCADTGGSHLNYVSGTGVTCGTSTGAAAAGTLTGTALNATVVTSSLTSVGTIGTGVWQGTAVGLAYGGTGQTTAAAARASTGLNIDQMTKHGDSIYTILATDRVVATSAAFTASRTWTLPAANAINAGQSVLVADLAGGVTGTNTLVIARAGADTINGGVSVTIAQANGAYLLVSDGVSAWTAQAQGSTAASGVTSIGGLTGVVGTAQGVTVSGSNVVVDKATAANYYAATANKVPTADVIYTAEVTVTYGLTTTFDFSTFNNAVVTLTGNITTMTFANVTAGKSGTIRFIQDATGSRTTVWNAALKWAGGVQPTLSTAANAVDVLNYSCVTATFCVASLMKAVQ